MGFAPTEKPLAEQYLSQFPVTANLTYLNHAAVSPLSKPCADAMRRLADDAECWGSLHYDEWLETYEGLRAAAARLVNAHRDEIAIVKNTSEGIATIALGLGFRAGDRVVAFREEFPANYYPWKQLEARGVDVRWLSVMDPLDRIAEACRSAKMLAISFVQYLSGYRADLPAIGRICKENGTFFLVDAIQGLGAFPLDVRAANIQALAADGHKWLTGPEGCGILYVQREWQDRIEPVEFGWTNVAGYVDYASRDMTLRPDAGRYEPGTLNTIGIYGLKAAIEFLLSVGIERIGEAVVRCAGLLADGARQKGYQLMTERTPETAAGIVSIRKHDVDARLVVQHLKRNNVIAAPRQGWVRLSPHFYISEEAASRAIDLLP
ncbi:MAG: aminotransferase class V-fold PLP-dependent enzyme [Bryobacteraceae bacterium]|nr:aminotransferase class V-fold PLP-dependent enzyme [Bryobacteraceae bacterium]